MAASFYTRVYYFESVFMLACVYLLVACVDIIMINTTHCTQRTPYTQTIYGLSCTYFPFYWLVNSVHFSHSFSLARFRWIFILLPFYCCHFIFAVDSRLSSPVFIFVFFCYCLNNNLCVCVCAHGNEFRLFFIINAGILKCIIKNNVICSKLKYIP